MGGLAAKERLATWYYFTEVIDSMRLKSVLPILLVSGMAIGQTPAPAKPRPQSTTMQAAFCKIDIANQTILVLPWDESARKLQKNSPRVLTWNSQTLLVSEPNSMTMAEFVNGKPLEDNLKNVADIVGDRGLFYITTVQGKAVIQKAELLANFGFEPIPAVGGNSGVQVLGSPGKVSCDDTPK